MKKDNLYPYRSVKTGWTWARQDETGRRIPISPEELEELTRLEEQVKDFSESTRQAQKWAQDTLDSRDALVVELYERGIPRRFICDRADLSGAAINQIINRKMKK